MTMQRVRSCFPAVCFALASIFITTAPLSASATVIQIFERGALGADDVIDWAVLGPAGTSLPNPFPILSEFGLASADVSKPAGSFQVFYQGTGGWLGNFALGDAVLWSRGDPGPIALEFAPPVVGAGAQIQSDVFATFTGVVAAFDSSGGLLGEFSLEGEVLANTGDNSAIFLGILSDSADIARIEFSLSEGLGFGINRVDIVTGPPTTTTTTTAAPTTTTTTTAAPTTTTTSTTTTTLPGIGRVVLCHRGRRTITAGAPSVAAHLQHGDSLGACPDMIGP